MRMTQTKLNLLAAIFFVLLCNFSFFSYNGADIGFIVSFDKRILTYSDIFLVHQVGVIRGNNTVYTCFGKMLAGGKWRHCSEVKIKRQSH